MVLHLLSILGELNVLANVLNKWKSENGKLTAKGSTPSAPLSVVQFHLPDDVATAVEEEVLNLHVVDTLQEELVFVPVEGLVVGVPDYLIVLE